MNDPGRWLVRLLEAYSPSGEEADGVAAFGGIARELGYVVRTDPAGNGIASKGSGRPLVVYLGHIDTVEGSIPVRIDGRRVFGRGACDAKGPLLAALLAGAEASGGGEIRVIAAVGEETDSRGARALIPEVRPDFVIGGEPSGWEGLAIGYKGDLRVLVTFQGSRSHLSSPSPSTTERALAWLDRARAPPVDGGGSFGVLTSKVVSIRTTGTGGSERVDVVLDLRLPPGVSTSMARSALPALTEEDSIQVLVEVEPFLSERTDPVVRALTSGIRAAGGRPTYLKKGGTSDLNLAAPLWGKGGAAYGPGDSHLDHTDLESLDLDELERAVRVLRHAFQELGRSAASLTPRPSGPGGG